jgi:PadR family transcriptional regulator PadR
MGLELTERAFAWPVGLCRTPRGRNNAGPLQNLEKVLLDTWYCRLYSTEMPAPLDDKLERDLSVGTAWLVVLATIARAEEAIHGYEIARQLAAEAPEGLSFKQGTLYPMLRTMESEGLLRSELVPSSEGPARKCFTLTADGRRVLVAWHDTWRRTNKWVNRVLGGVDELR